MIDNADQAFKLFDADGDGKINGEELKALVDKVGEDVRMIMMIRAIMVMIQVGGNMTAGEADALIRKVWYQDNSNCFTVSNTIAIFLLPYITYKQQKLSQYLFEQKSWLCLFRRTSI